MLGCFAAALVVLVLRLVDLQVVHAEFYKQRAADALLLEPKSLPFVRGSILDRSGRVLASDEPSWEVRVDYGILAGDPQYTRRMVRRLRRAARYGADLSEDAVAGLFRDEVEEMWSDLSRLSGQPRAELDRRARAIAERVQRVRATVARGRGFDASVAEERLRHAVLARLDDQQQVAARTVLARYPWVSVDSSARRVYHDGLPLAHVLGALGPVDEAAIREDPHADDPAARYEPNEMLGIMGVEAAAEPILRGRRGRVRQTLEGDLVEETAPVHGRDVELTLRYDLQSRLYRLLGGELEFRPQVPGGAVVVLDVCTREVLALVSCPAYDPDRFREDSPRLQGDTQHLPLRFRAVANQYEPGSIVKPLACLAGLSSGRITLQTTFDCTGSLLPDQPDRWRCWPIPGTSQRKAHGTLSVVAAIEGSCNVFLFHVGQLVGVDDLTNFFGMFGFGRLTGTGLPEEASGINPTPDWIATTRHRAVTPGDARNYAVGQGEVLVTPIQAANMMAVYASGFYKPVTLIRAAGPEPPSWQLPARPEHWQAIREGLFRVVNSPQGTAYKYARFEQDGWVLCGKTGSAQTRPWPVSYRVSYVDASGQECAAVVAAGSYDQAVAEFLQQYPDGAFEPTKIRVYERFPPDADDPAHAWFGGYLQRVDGLGRPMWDPTPRIAFALLVEFGGSGGRTSGPIARQVARVILETLGPDLDPDGPPTPEPDS